jgi:ubiquinone/menaquinone biosynthesis C-methylase UbiE
VTRPDDFDSVAGEARRAPAAAESAPVFDAHADDYRDAVAKSISFAGQEHDYFARRKAEYLTELTDRHVGDPGGLSVLDIGCGVGVVDAFLVPKFRELHGVDVAGEAVARAERDHPDGNFCVYDGGTLPFPDDTFDVAFAACVLHHIDRPDRPAFVAEMQRVVRPGGIGVVFEHNLFNPLTRLAVRRCEFDVGVHLLSKFETTRLLRSSGVDPIASAYIILHTSSRPALDTLERRLASVPLGSQYFVAFRPARHS